MDWRTARSEQGFTLIELLVVIMIIGVLAAIAIPSFLNQRQKAKDACGKSMVKTMQTAMDAYYVERGSYAGATPTALNAVEASIPVDGSDPCEGGWDTILTGSQSAGTNCNGNAPGTNNYCLFIPTPNGQGFRLYRSTAGVVTRNCVLPGEGGCPSSGTW